MFDELHEECGVFGALNLEDAASLTYYGLHSLQHRGQEASGIAACSQGEMSCHKGKGLTIDVFSRATLDQLPGRCAIGHVRYSTAGGQEYENIQPITARSLTGNIAIVHNGQIVNDRKLRRELEEDGCIFQGTSDSEVILHLLMRQQGDLADRVAATAARLAGAFSFLVMQEDRIIAVRDPWGLRPLSFARFQDGWVISSETCAFEVMGIYNSVTIEPGHLVDFHRGLVRTRQYAQQPSHNMCAMEYIYFARPDSVIEGVNVHAFRKETGRQLARQDDGFQADLVVAVPDSSISAAMGYAEQSGIPMETGLVKNRFVTRSFIVPDQSMRDRTVAMKLSPVHDVVAGKSLILIDDSIVRGTTSRRIVSLLRNAGAREIHVRIASPRLVSPCFYGVDISTSKELIAACNSDEEICEYIGADSLRFLTEEDMRQAADGQGLCLACFDRNYCTELYEYGKDLENQEVVFLF